ncbi:MAG: lipase, partial [Rhodococcus sp. (in: high G+C Gram-positive bacteria)]
MRQLPLPQPDTPEIETTMITTDISDTLLHGAAELERTDNGVLPHRLPRAARQRFTDPQLTMAESQPSGVRLVFTTTATIIEI